MVNLISNHCVIEMNISVVLYLCKNRRATLKKYHRWFIASSAFTLKYWRIQFRFVSTTLQIRFRNVLSAITFLVLFRIYTALDKVKFKYLSGTRQNVIFQFGTIPFRRTPWTLLQVQYLLSLLTLNDPVFIDMLWMLWLQTKVQPVPYQIHFICFHVFDTIY